MKFETFFHNQIRCLFRPISSNRQNQSIHLYYLVKNKTNTLHGFPRKMGTHGVGHLVLHKHAKK